MSRFVQEGDPIIVKRKRARHAASGASTVRETIDGRPATVAYMTRMGGRLVSADEAQFAVIRFDDGDVSYVTFDSNEGVTDGNTDTVREP